RQPSRQGHGWRLAAAGGSGRRSGPLRSDHASHMTSGSSWPPGNRLGSLIVDGRRHDVNPQAERSLLVVLREELGLAGAKYGCGEGACGACTVLLDGEPVRSCVTSV